MVEFMLEDPCQPPFCRDLYGGLLGRGAPQYNPFRSHEGKAKIGHREATLKVIVGVSFPSLERSYVKSGVDDGTLLEDSVVIRPFPDEYLLRDTNLRGS